MKPAIVVVAYNRDKSLERILISISNGQYLERHIPLVISIDKSENPLVAEVANRFEWEYGEKEIILHEQNLGLRKHILSCGDLSNKYGSVIVLEDDLFVSPYFYTYCQRMLADLKQEEKIGGFSLYSYDFNEFVRLPFAPIYDGYDNYYIQTASSWGQLWTKDQWDGFKSWYCENQDDPLTAEDLIPNNVIGWPKSSWKKYFIKYLVKSNKYFFFPRISLTTNFSDFGTHQKSIADRNFQVPLAMDINQNMHFSRVDQSKSVYDVFFELKPELFTQYFKLDHENVVIDLYGQKDLKLYDVAYAISVKECKKKLESYRYEMFPHELNLMLPGLEEKNGLLNFSETKNFSDELSSKIRIKVLLSLTKVYRLKVYLQILRYFIISKIQKLL